MHPDWARKLHDDCVQIGTAFFFKQWGKFIPAVGDTGDGDIYFPDADHDNSTDPFGDGTYMMAARGGKWPGGEPELGRRLDGVIHAGIPEIAGGGDG